MTVDYDDGDTNFRVLNLEWFNKQPAETTKKDLPFKANQQKVYISSLKRAQKRNRLQMKAAEHDGDESESDIEGEVEEDESKAEVEARNKFLSGLKPSSKVRVWWPSYQKWFNATFKSFQPHNGTVKVRYEDNDKNNCILKARNLNGIPSNTSKEYVFKVPSLEQTEQEKVIITLLDHGADVNKHNYLLRAVQSRREPAVRAILNCKVVICANFPFTSLD